MEFLVNGRKFTNIDEAREYERQLELAKTDKVSEYKKYIRSKLQVYKVKKEKISAKYIAVIVDDNNHYNYMDAIVSKLFGNQYEIAGNKLCKRWDVSVVTDGDIIDSIIDNYVDGTGDKFFVLFVGNDIKSLDDDSNDNDNSGAYENTDTDTADEDVKSDWGTELTPEGFIADLLTYLSENI